MIGYKINNQKVLIKPISCTTISPLLKNLGPKSYQVANPILLAIKLAIIAIIHIDIPIK